MIRVETLQGFTVNLVLFVCFCVFKWSPLGEYSQCMISDRQDVSWFEWLQFNSEIPHSVALGLSQADWLSCTTPKSQLSNGHSAHRFTESPEWAWSPVSRCREKGWPQCYSLFTNLHSVSLTGRKATPLPHTNSLSQKTHSPVQIWLKKYGNKK